MRHFALLAATIVVPTVLVACGGDGGNGDRLSKEEYEQEVSAIGQTFSEGLGSIAGASAPGEISEQFDEAQDQLESIADRLEEISPPEDVEEAHDRLVAGLNALSGDLDDIGGRIEEAAAEAQEENDPAVLLELYAELSTLDSIEELQAVSQEFEEKGYDLGLDEAAAAAGG
jgi:hypothetical protein